MTTTSLKPPGESNLWRYYHQPRIRRGEYQPGVLSLEAEEALMKDPRWRPEHTSGHHVRPRTAEEVMAIGRVPSRDVRADREAVFKTAVRHCRAHGSTTARAISLVVGVTEACANHHLSVLSTAGALQSVRSPTGMNTWRLTEEGGVQ